MKKIIALALSSVMVLTLFACGKASEEESTNEEYTLNDDADLTLSDDELLDEELDETEVYELLEETDEEELEVPEVPQREEPEASEKPTTPPPAEQPNVEPPAGNEQPAVPPEGEHAPAVPPEGEHAPAVPPEDDGLDMPEMGGTTEGMGQGGTASVEKFNAIYATVGDGPYMELLDEQFLIDFYGIDPSLYNSFAFSKAMMMTNIDEICIIEATDGNVDAVKAILTARAENVANPAFNYPSNIEIAENYVILVKGNFVMYAVGTFVDDFASKF